MESWHERPRQHGLRQLAVLPLRRGGEVVGLLAVATVESDFIGEAVAALLREMALDISFALDNYDREAQRQAALAQTQQLASRLAAVVDTVPMGIVALDTEGRVTMWNRGAERIFGWSEDETLGRLPPFLPATMHEDYLTRSPGNARAVFTGDESSAAAKDGSAIDLLLHSAPLRDAIAGSIGILGMMLDISDRKRAEERLRLAATVFEGSLDAILVTRRHSSFAPIRCSSASWAMAGGNSRSTHRQLPQTVSR